MDSKGKLSCDSSSEGLMLIKTLTKVKRESMYSNSNHKDKSFQSRSSHFHTLWLYWQGGCCVHTHLPLFSVHGKLNVQTPKVKENIIPESSKYSINVILCFGCWFLMYFFKQTHGLFVWGEADRQEHRRARLNEGC